jgi:enoyl-CoA hydratase
MVLFSEVVSGEEAAARGLVWRCVADDELIDVCVSTAAKAAAHPRELSIRTKATLKGIVGLELHADAVDAELETQVWSINQPAFADRLAALQSRISSD